MNEADFETHWNSEKPIYDAWGEFVVDEITSELESEGKVLDIFLKVPVKHRLKEIQSMLDKAFHRPDKSYTDPYNEIEDKVGARFIVLFLDDIQSICNIIESSESWTFEVCKHFGKDKRTDPLLFTYQSIHYILKPKQELSIGSIIIPESIPCEIQLRTLLQHAHAELTHDAIYKAKKKIEPEVHRTVAKSMALIETTDDFFTLATKQLSNESFDKYSIRERLDSIYFGFTGMKPYFQKSSIILWDEYENYIDENLVDNIQTVLKENGFLSDRIKSYYLESSFYQQSSILFIYWMLSKRRINLIRSWPFKRELLLPLANDLGVGILDE